MYPNAFVHGTVAGIGLSFVLVIVCPPCLFLFFFLQVSFCFSYHTSAVNNSDSMVFDTKCQSTGSGRRYS